MRQSSLNIGFALVVFFGSSFAMPADAQLFKRLGVAEAQERCILRTERFAASSLGPASRPPTAFEIRSKYKRCFYGYTGQNAQTVPELDLTDQSFGLFRKITQ